MPQRTTIDQPSVFVKKLTEAYGYFKSYKYSILFSVIVCLLFACVFQMYSEPVYRINSILQINGIRKNFNTVIMPGKNALNLKAKSIIHKTIEKSPLMVSYEMEVDGKTLELYSDQSPVQVQVSYINPGLYNRSMTVQLAGNGQTFTATGLGITGSHPLNTLVHYKDIEFRIVKNNAADYTGGVVRVKFNNPNELASVYAKKLNIKTNASDNRTVVLSVVDEHPQKGIDFLNTLSRVYANVRLDERSSAKKMMLSIDDSIRLIKNELLLLDKKSSRQAEVKTVSMPERTVRRNNITEKQKALFSLLNTYLAKPQNLFIQLPGYSTGDLVLDQKITDYNTLQLKKQIDGNNDTLFAELRSMQASIHERMNTLQNPVEEVKYVTAKKAVLPVAKTTDKFQPAKLTRQKELNRLNIEKKNLLAKTDTPKISIVKKPTYSRLPFVFEATLLYLGAVVLGLVLPMPVIYAKNLLAKNVLSNNDISKLTDVPLMGYMSHHGEGSEKISSIADFGRYKYELSVITRQLENLAVKKRGTVIVISSAINGEGKSYMANHLSLALAGLSKSVVFVDMNLVNYSETENPGLVNYIADKNMTEDDIIVSSPKSSGLFFIGAGKEDKKKVYDDLPFYQWEVGKRERSRIKSMRVKKLIAQLRKKFDYVVLDTSSVLQEPEVLSAYVLADIQLHIVRYNYTKKESLKNAVALSKESGTQMFIVFNDIKHTSPQFYKTAHTNYQSLN